MNGKKGRAGQYYFCYGDDMGDALIRKICTNPSLACVARLPGYRLEFVGHSKRWDGADEGLVKDTTNEVWGVVYRLGYTDGDRLDAWKDIRLNGTGSRFHYLADVVSGEGNAMQALVYQKTELGLPGVPGSEYLHAVVSAARARGLPDEWIERLRSKPSRPASYPVPRKGPIDYADLSALYCDCGKEE